MPIPSVNDYSERQNRAVARILDQFDRANQRTEQHYSRVRKHERKPFRGLLSIFMPTPERMEPPLDGSGCFTCWSYSLSSGGVGFILPAEVPAKELFVGVHLPGGAIRWLTGRVVRCRLVPEEEFFDYGVAFGTAPAGPAATSAQEPAMAHV